MKIDLMFLFLCRVTKSDHYQSRVGSSVVICAYVVLRWCGAFRSINPSILRNTCLEHSDRTPKLCSVCDRYCHKITTVWVNVEGTWRLPILLVS